MSLEPLPDHYKALGIDKNADAATIKKTYRKLVLTCHPDKVTDEALKAQKQDEFHKIQQAYETLSDETRRATYEAELKLQQLRREKLARTASGSTTEPKNARFTTSTAGGATYTGTTRSSYATEERRPSGTTSSSRTYYEDDRYDSRRKAEDPSYFPRARSPRPSPSHRSSREKTDKYYEKESRSAKPSSDRTRSSTTKARDNERRDRTHRFPQDSEGSSGDDKTHFERSYKTRSGDDDSRRRAEEYRRDDRRYDDYESSTPRKLSVQESDALRYIHKSQVEANIRPSMPSRTTSRDYYEPSSRSSRHREVRQEPAPRRSSAKPRERLERRGTDRGIPEVMEWADERRPNFKQSSSSPAEIRIPTEVRSPPQRSQTESHRRSGSPPPRPFNLSRSATMPVNAGSEAGGSRREKTYPRPSALRNETNGSPERDAYPSIPAPQTSSSKTYYSYNPAEGGVKQMDTSPLHNTVTREPGRRHRSPSPLGKPPMGSNRPTLSHAKTYAPGRSSRQSSPVRETRGRSGRDEMKYGEVPSKYTHEHGMRERQPSYSPHNVSYAPRYGPEDVRWAPRGSDESRPKEYKEYRPSLSRTATSVY